MLKTHLTLALLILMLGTAAFSVTSQEEEEMKKLQLRICVNPEASEEGKTKSLLGPANPAGPCTPGMPAIPTALPYQPNEFFIAKKQNDEKRLKMLFATEFVTIRELVTGTLNGVGVGATALYSLSSQSAFGFTVNQAFTAKSTAMFTKLDLELRWALTGTLSMKSSRVLVYDQSVVESDSLNRGGLRAQVFLHQYFMNTTYAALPFPGAGIGLTYDLPSADMTNYYFGVRVDRASNDKMVVYPLQAFFGIGLWL